MLNSYPEIIASVITNHFYAEDVLLLLCESLLGFSTKSAKLTRLSPSVNAIMDQ